MTQTINFYGTIPNCYKSLDWENFSAYAGDIIYISNSGTISRDTAFSVISVYIINSSNFPITFTAFSNGQQVGQYVASTTGTVNFPQDPGNTFTNIDSISASGSFLMSGLTFCA
jgi:hypothetical protein